MPRKKEDAMEENPPTPPVRSDDLSSTSKPSRSRTRTVIVWIVVLLVAAGLFWLVLTADSQRGTVSIGVYVEAIGTVTPVYTSSITSQVSGIVTAVHYTEGQLVQKGAPLIEIDSRPYAATLAQAKGILERDKGILAQAQMDLARYQAAWARNAIPKQTLDDQEKLVAQDPGHGA
jgi:multidrug efflux system membrane fusion protein